MRKTVLKRMEQELKGYREYLITGELTPEQILDESYQFLVEQKIHCNFEDYNYSRLASKEWNWLSRQKQPRRNSLNFYIMSWHQIWRCIMNKNQEKIQSAFERIERLGKHQFGRDLA